MKLTVLFLLVSTLCFGQVKDTAKSKAPVVNDSTALLSYKDVGIIKQYLGDKLIGKDYELVVTALYDLINQRAKEYQKPKNK